MDVEQIKTFLQVAELKNYSKAAVNLHITQPAVSVRIKALEEEIGQTLIERKGKSITLTSAGQYFYNNMKGIVENINTTVSTIKEFSSPSTLTIGASLLVTNYVFTNLLPTFFKQEPSVQKNIRVIPQPSHLIELYMKEIVDLAVFTASELPQSVQAKLLWKENIVLAADASHPFDKEVFTLDDLQDYPILTVSPENDWLRYNQELLHLCEENGIDLNIEVSTDNLDFAKSLLKMKEFVSFIPEISIEEEVKRGELRKIPFQSPLELSLGVYILFRNRNKHLLQFYNLIIDYVRENFNTYV